MLKADRQVFLKLLQDDALGRVALAADVSSYEVRFHPLPLPGKVIDRGTRVQVNGTYHTIERQRKNNITARLNILPMEVQLIRAFFQQMVRVRRL